MYVFKFCSLEIEFQSFCDSDELNQLLYLQGSPISSSHTPFTRDTNKTNYILFRKQSYFFVITCHGSNTFTISWTLRESNLRWIVYNIGRAYKVDILSSVLRRELLHLAFIHVILGWGYPWAWQWSADCCWYSTEVSWGSITQLGATVNIVYCWLRLTSNTTTAKATRFGKCILTTYSLW